MGVSNGSKKCVYSIEGLSLEDVMTVVRHRHAAGGHDSRPPTVDIDGNLWGCKWSSKNEGSVKVIVELVKQIISKGVNATVGVDGSSRHNSKRASTQRAAKREKARIEASLARSEINSAVQELQEEPMNQEQHEQKENHLKLLENKVKSKERECRQLLDDTFVAELSDALSNFIVNETNENQGKVEFIEAVLQLYPVIVYRARQGYSDLVISSDSDFSAMLKKEGLQLSAVTHSARGNKFSNFKLSSGALEPITAAVDALKIEKPGQCSRLSLFFKQMGEWYLQDQCIGKTAGEIMFASTEAEPLITCHYRDKPSKYPCKNSPPIDNGRGSFW